MRVGIFFQAGEADSNENEINDLLAKLKEISVSASAYRMGPSWEKLDGEEIIFNFSSISHFVIKPSRFNNKSRWIPFISGFCLGSSKTGLIYGSDSMDLAPYLSIFDNFDSPKALLKYLAEEQEIWECTHQIETARDSLISLGLGINEENFSQRIAVGDEEASENFLKIGYSPDTLDPHGVPLVCLATRNGHRKIVDLLLKRKVDVNVLSLDRGNSPLMESAVRGDDYCSKRFLEAGADPNLVSKSGQTALMLAVGEGHKDIVKMLMEKGSKTDIQDSLGMTARKYATIFRNDDILSVMNVYEPQALASS